MKRLLIFILFGISSLSFGAEIIPGDVEQDYVEYSFEEPTAREDGTALPVNEIQGYKIYQYHQGQLDQVFEITGPPFLAEINKKGQYTAMISTVDSDGFEGAKSDPVPFLVTDELISLPLPPSNSALNINQKCSIDCNYQITNGQ